MSQNNLFDNKLTYISLFSSAGVGCYGFQLEGFECVASNELIPRRLEIQKFNHKCKYDKGYILGDISDESIKGQLFEQVKFWRENEDIEDIDVLIATPPCQGMSVANHKKTENEIARNSLVVESIKIAQEIRPKIFIFENVPAFLKTICTDIDGEDKTIGEAIDNNLGPNYAIYSEIVNLKHYGACSSRSRAFVIAVRKDYDNFFAPLELFPNRQAERTLLEVIGNYKSLQTMGEVDDEDFYHSFRTYPAHMRSWISKLKEGQSAFDNEDISRIPHKIVDGEIVFNVQKNGDKYRRQIWDKVGPCVHTRNDQLASQNTIHPSDDRVFSVSELMEMMTIPKSFKWVDKDLSELNKLPFEEKQKLLKKEELKIRQSIGEAVPTSIFQNIASNAKHFLGKNYLRDIQISKEIKNKNLDDCNQLLDYIGNNPMNLGFSSLSKIAELANSNRESNAAYFTDKSLINAIANELPDIDSEHIRILEPSVGTGNFLPFLIKKYSGAKTLSIDLVDIDENVMKVLRALFKHVDIPSNVSINLINADFLKVDLMSGYDLVIGNPPFDKLSPHNSALKYYKKNVCNTETNNISAFFLEKAMQLGKNVILVMPKFLLNTPEFFLSRQLIEKSRINMICDFGEKGFKGVLIETVAIAIAPNLKPSKTKIVSLTGKTIIQNQKYICDYRFPYWLIYRDNLFDEVCGKLKFGVFDVFRDRQITNAHLSDTGEIRVIKSRNINDDGTDIVDLPQYDAYIDSNTASQLAVYKFIERDDVYLTPNMTYKPRVIQKPKGTLVNGSSAILIPKSGEKPLSQKEMLYFSSNEYRAFYKIARNHQTRSLNVDANSVFFFGRLKEEAVSCG